MMVKYKTVKYKLVFALGSMKIKSEFCLSFSKFIFLNEMNEVAFFKGMTGTTEERCGAHETLNLMLNCQQIVVTIVC